MMRGTQQNSTKCFLESGSLENVKKELNFAKGHNITISPNERLIAKDGLLKNERLFYKLNLTLSYDGGTENLTIEFPILYGSYTTKKGNLTYIGFHPAIDGWFF
jgi:hypothetical protein